MKNSTSSWFSFHNFFAKTQSTDPLIDFSCEQMVEELKNTYIEGRWDNQMLVNVSGITEVCFSDFGKKAKEKGQCNAGKKLVED